VSSKPINSAKTRFVPAIVPARQSLEPALLGHNLNFCDVNNRSEARQISHAYTLAYVLSIGCQGDWAVLSNDLILRRAEELVAIATEDHFIAFLQPGKILRGWCKGTIGQQAGALALLHEGLDAMYRAGGSKLFEPTVRVLCADVYGQARQLQVGLDQLAEAERIVDATNERWVEAELHRVRGKLLTALGEFSYAEDSLRKAISIGQPPERKVI
jgi:predicted ATPase